MVDSLEWTGHSHITALEIPNFLPYVVNQDKTFDLLLIYYHRVYVLTASDTLKYTHFYISANKLNSKFLTTTVDLDYNNIGCNETSAVAKRFSGTVFFFSKQLY